MTLSKSELRHFKTLLKSMDFKEEDIKEELKNLISHVNSLPDKITLYRIIFADNISDINKEELGAHYSISKKDLLDSHSYASGYGVHKFLFTVEVNKDMVDFVDTISNNILYPNENEITLKNKGKGIKIISIKKLKTT
jgi:hypothetical protein